MSADARPPNPRCKLVEGHDGPCNFDPRRVPELYRCPKRKYVEVDADRSGTSADLRMSLAAKERRARGHKA